MNIRLGNVVWCRKIISTFIFLFSLALDRCIYLKGKAFVFIVYGMCILIYLCRIGTADMIIPAICFSWVSVLRIGKDVREEQEWMDLLVYFLLSLIGCHPKAASRGGGRVGSVCGVLQRDQLCCRACQLCVPYREPCDVQQHKPPSGTRWRSRQEEQTFCLAEKSKEARVWKNLAEHPIWKSLLLSS